jgi:hypothetical protein
MRRRIDVDADDTGQHEQRAQHGVDHVFQRRVDAPLAAPRADQQVRGDQHALPEEVEQDEVERDEDT